MSALRLRDVRLITGAVGLSAFGDFLLWIPVALHIRELTPVGRRSANSALIECEPEASYLPARSKFAITFAALTNFAQLFALGVPLSRKKMPEFSETRAGI